MTLCPQDRALLDAWSRDGIPADRSTRDVAALAVKAWAHIVEVEAVVDQLLATDMEASNGH